MIRIIIENILLFLLPTAAYVAYVAIMRRNGASAREILDGAPLVWLFAAGAGLVLLVLVMFSNTSGGKPGQAYQPPVFRDGKIQPGHSE